MNTIQLTDGWFDVQDHEGKTLLEPFGGPFRPRETAEATERMLAAFDVVDSQIKTINQSLGQVASE